VELGYDEDTFFKVYKSGEVEEFSFKGDTLWNEYTIIQSIDKNQSKSFEITSHCFISFQMNQKDW